jgi:hypothetical protein
LSFLWVELGAPDGPYVIFHRRAPIRGLEHPVAPFRARRAFFARAMPRVAKPSIAEKANTASARSHMNVLCDQ